MTRVLIGDVDVEGRRVDVRTVDGTVAAVGPGLTPTDEDEVVDGEGGALIPGLHDHHLHLLALAADRASVDCSEDLGALASRGGEGWVRGVRARESVDRHTLDRLVPDRPVRVQHRSGALWMLNSRALAEVAGALDDSPDVERDERGEPTGRLFRYDARLRPALPETDHGAGLAAVVGELRGLGITSVTDATPDLDAHAVDLLRGLPLPVTLLGDPGSDAPEKVVVGDHDLPSLEALVARVRQARDRRHAVAVHAVTREALLLTLVALDEVGRHPGDRIEHAAVVPDPRALRGLTVVTQPGFLADRGDDYLRDVHAADLPCLYRFGSLLDAGVDTLASSDAPYGPLDPWAVIAAAVERRTPAGAVLGPGERVDATTALAGYLRDAEGRPRRVRPGQRTGLALLDRPLAAALAGPARVAVRAAWPNAVYS